MNPTRVFDFLQVQANSYPREVALAEKVNGQWETFSTHEVINIVNRISTGMLKAGIQRGDKIAIISANRPEWNFVDLAMQQIGAVSVPMYPTITVKDYHYIFSEAEVKMVFVSNQELLDKVNKALKTIDGVKKVYAFDTNTSGTYWKEIMSSEEEVDMDELRLHKDEVKSEDLLTLIYTSGTTGNPKGVMLTHNNILTNAIAVSKLFPAIGQHKKALSFLPICHIFERTAIYFYIYTGVSIYYAENLESIGDNLKEVKPNLFTTVPRLLEKVYDKIVAKGHTLTGVKKSLFFWALDLGMQFDLQQPNRFMYNLKMAIARKLIFSKWQEALGGNIELIISGGAALQPRLATIFWAADLKVLEAYGLTETSPGICFNRMDDTRIGTVGPTLENIEIKIAADGEVLCKGPNVMQGYYKQPELTAEVLKDGWFHTGDIGEIIDGKYLKITDRKKEMFKTSGGKYIAPQPMENKFKESIFIEQIMVVGEGEKFPAALVVPNFDSLKEWCQKKGIEFGNNESAINHPQVIAKMEKEQERYNEHFAQFEKIKKIKLLPRLWTVEDGELTAKLSLRRKIISEHFENEIKSLFVE